ncbi:MAG: AzlD domain-containing protein [Kiritimatiellae bacterium]|nr:AzlD domain-containing protein [Kiritimatiellia bacterium]
MSRNALYLAGLLAATGLTTLLLRAFPFLFFGSGKGRHQGLIRELGMLISPAAIAMLIVYCYSAYFDGATWAEKGYGIAEWVSGGVVVLIHFRFKNPLLSILCGTAVYMFFVQKLFAG